LHGELQNVEKFAAGNCGP